MELPRPDILMARFERGEITREELHAVMALHARALIREMEEDHQNPAAALLERLLAGRHARRLVKCHGARLVRDCLVALSEVADFPPADFLWNASHPDLPLHCFMRITRRPMFRLVSIHRESSRGVRCLTEHGTAAGDARPTRITWRMERDDAWRLRVVTPAST
jgi:hypothetical protein